MVGPALTGWRPAVAREDFGRLRTHENGDSASSSDRGGEPSRDIGPGTRVPSLPVRLSLRGLVPVSGTREPRSQTAHRKRAQAAAVPCTLAIKRSNMARVPRGRRPGSLARFSGRAGFARSHRPRIHAPWCATASQKQCPWCYTSTACLTASSGTRSRCAPCRAVPVGRAPASSDTPSKAQGLQLLGFERNRRLSFLFSGAV